MDERDQPAEGGERRPIPARKIAPDEPASPPDGDPAEEERTRPLPVRDLGGGGEPGRRRGSPVREGGARQGRPRPGDADRRRPGPPSPARPLSVRDNAPAPAPEEPPPGPPPVRFHHGEEEWEVRVGGRTSSGSPGDRGAPLLLLRFAPVRGGEADEAERELLLVGRELGDRDDDELGLLLGRARPVPTDDEVQEVFSPARRPRKRR